MSRNSLEPRTMWSLEEIVVKYHIFRDNVCDPLDVVAVHYSVILVKHDKCRRLGDHAFHGVAAAWRRIPRQPGSLIHANGAFSSSTDGSLECAAGATAQVPYSGRSRDRISHELPVFTSVGTNRPGWQVEVSPQICSSVGCQHQRQLFAWPRRLRSPSN
jgi:hypothetical protein